MNNTKNVYEVIKFEDGEFSLDVNVSPTEDTVWLSQKQMSILFNTSKQNISLHISNIFKEKELVKIAVVKEFLTTGSDGKKYNIEHFNLDVIISVGYRVKSQRGILFRKWATSILKQYMLKGYSINEKRCLECQDNIISLNNKVNILIEHDINHTKMIEELYDINKSTKDKLFYEDEIYDAYSYIKQFFLSAKASIILIDGYIDLSVLDMLVDVIVPITIYTYPNAQLTNLDIDRFNIKHSLEVFRTSKIHDRFIIIDNIIYLCGSSIKDVGKKRFVLTKLESFNVNDLINNITFVKKGKNNE